MKGKMFWFPLLGPKGIPCTWWGDWNKRMCEVPPAVCSEGKELLRRHFAQR